MEGPSYGGLDRKQQTTSERTICKHDSFVTRTRTDGFLESDTFITYLPTMFPTMSTTTAQNGIRRRFFDLMSCTNNQDTTHT